MAMAARYGMLELSIGSGTLRGTIAGVPIHCRVQPGVGLVGRISEGSYQFSAPAGHATLGTVAYAAFESASLETGLSGTPARNPAGSSSSAGQRGAVMFDPEKVEIHKNVSWQEQKGEVDLLQWALVGGAATLVFASRASGGLNEVVVLTGFDTLMKALTAAGGCPLRVVN